MATDGFGTTLRVLLNSLAFFVLVVLALYLFNYNPLWAVLILLSAFDQLEDVYFYTTGNRLIPAWFRPVDIILEGVLVLVGVSMAIFGLIYWFAFDSMFFFLWMVASAFMAWSAIEDVVEGFDVVSAKVRGVTIATVKAPSNFTFFKKVK